MENNQTEDYLECERWWIYALLMAAAGYLGTFTYGLRGGVFCNAQTGNFVLLALSLGQKKYLEAAYYIIPITAYFMGAVLSEILPHFFKKVNAIRWDTGLIGFEIIVIVILGFLPESAPFQISQVAINFICSMQYNTFRQAQGIPMATTFCTNHLRQTGIHLTKWLRKKTPDGKKRFFVHLFMLVTFALGGFVGARLGTHFLGKSVWGAAVLLAFAFLDLLYADLKTERGQLNRKPHGH